jgi:hypothetical protein
MRKFALLLCGCFAVFFVCPGQVKDSLQNFYVKTFHDYFFLGPVLKKRELSFNIVSERDARANLSFKPNSSYSIGLNLNVFDLNLEVSASIPLDIKSINRFGESQVKDVQIGAWTRKVFFDAYFQKYSGFYYSYPSLMLPPNQAFPQRSDIDTRNLGFSIAYVFNNEKFSLRSSYTFIDQQIKSKGSFILGFVISSFDIRADSALIPASLRQVTLQSEVDAARFSSLGLAPGYSYNLVFKKLFMNITLSLGPAHYWMQYHIKELSTHNDIEINAYSAFRIALGYNGDRFFSGISYNEQGRNVTFNELKLSNKISTFRLVAGYRFREFGLLKKRALDYTPGIRKRR